MTLKKGDFIEIEFTGRIKDGEIFDSNIKEDLKETSLDFEPKPFTFGLGENMFLQGVEDFLIGKDLGKELEVELSPEKAFGKRNPKLMNTISMKTFRENNLNPVPGAMFNFDGRAARILSVSGGRVTIDFNNPLSGKDVIYKVKVLRKVEDLNDKAKALINFLFKQEMDFEIKDKKIIIKAKKELHELLNMFKDKFKSALDLDLELKEIEEPKESKKVEEGKEDEKSEEKKDTIDNPK
jgi:FKBP-type peptidyl-prolyl cis-trans isomerase 2